MPRDDEHADALAAVVRLLERGGGSAFHEEDAAEALLNALKRKRAREERRERASQNDEERGREDDLAEPIHGHMIPCGFTSAAALLLLCESIFSPRSCKMRNGS